jgi:hypothetical protein
MPFEPPDFVEINMDAELTAYCDDVATDAVPEEEADTRTCESGS